MRRLIGALLLVAGFLASAPAVLPQQPDAPPKTQQREQVFYGSKRSNVYHRASCRYVARINSGNLISFSSRAEAQKAGYRPCKVCLP